MTALLPGAPLAPIPPDPDDRLSGYAAGWGLWVAAFALLEGYALYQDRRHDDRIKRTLSANLRYAFATDSVTGIPVNVPLGKLRRFALVAGEAWLTNHLQQNGRM